MRKSTVFRALGGTALALGLVAGGATVATADNPEAAPASDSSKVAEGQLEAMQRDLGLSADQAKDRMKQEDQARSTKKELKSKLGDTFGGSFFDADKGKLNVAVTDKSATDQVREAGATPKVVTYGEDKLESYAEDLKGQKPSLDKGIATYGPDTSEDALAVTALKGKKDTAQQLAKDAGVPADAVKVTETKDKPRTYADIVGGTSYDIDGLGSCSIGFGTENGFVTAGHCGEEGASVSQDDGTGTVSGSVFPGSDMGAVQADDNWTPTADVESDQGTTTVAGSEESDEGAAICRSGATTGWHCGTVGAKGQTVEYPEGTVEGLTQTDVCAEPGDSGGSWLSEDQAQGVTSGGSGDCSSGGETFFQPVNPILEEFGETLVTG